MNRRRAAGLTLIELLVALTIFAILALVSYRALASLLDARDRLAGENRRWRQIGQFVQLVENDLLQAVPRPVRDAGGGLAPAMQASASAGNGLLAFTRIGGGTGIVRRAYLLGGQSVSLMEWPAPDAVPGTTPLSDVVLDGATGLRWTFLDATGAWRPDWPPAGTPPSELPRAVRLELTLADLGVVSRIMALR